MAALRVLNVAEKNDAAKAIATCLSGGQFRRREGRSPYNKIYEFQSELLGQQARMVFTSVSGHLLNFDFPAAYNSWQGVDPLQLFAAPVERVCPQRSTPVRDTLRDEARHADTLVVWTDCDREGENIGYEVIGVCREANARLRVKRAHFSEITPQSVLRAAAHLAEPDPRMSDAVDCRSELDLRIGAAFTRLQTLFLRRRLPAIFNGDTKVISYGSCQFPTLGFVVERYKLVEEFVPEPFWSLSVEHERRRQRTHFHWARERLFEREACETLLLVCEQNPAATVEQVAASPRTRRRPQPLDTLQLEKMATRRLQMTARAALNTAEALYTKGLISYPRTETTIFPPELDLNAVVEAQSADTQWGWGAFAADVLQRGGANPMRGYKTDSAHPPIYPTKYAARAELNAEQGRLYNFVVRHLLACVSRNAEGMETTVNIRVASEHFHATGLNVTDRGYLDVYDQFDQWTTTHIPDYVQGETFEPDAVQMTEGATTPPQLLTEADLLTLMDRHGIGTDATSAEHIETIKARKYVGLRDGRFFVPGFLGLGLVDGYDSMGLHMSKPDKRAELEAQLKLICEGRRTRDQVLDEQLAAYRRIFEQTHQQMDRLDGALGVYFRRNDGAPAAPPVAQAIAPAGVLRCPRCQAAMRVRSNRQAGDFFLGCSAYPNCTGTVALPRQCLDGAAESSEQCRQCANGTLLVALKFKTGQRPAGISRLNYTSCLVCDPKLRDWRLQQRPAPPPPQARAAAPAGQRARQAVRPPPQAPPAALRAPQLVRPAGRAQPAPWGQPPGGAPQTQQQQGQLMCGCNVPARLLVVRKDGPNKGRQFHTCCNGQSGNGCGFFAWAS